MSFIENLTATSINMDPEEFECYISGKSVPLESWRSNLLMCDGLQKMSQNLKLLSELKSQHDKILQDAKSLHEEMSLFQTNIKSEVDIVLDRTNYTIKPRTKEPVGIDDVDLEPPSDLPAPLIPDLSSTATQESNPTLVLNNEATLEDYFVSGDNMSLLSLDLSSGQGDSMSLDDSLTYRGFSAQSSSIPSISCVSAVPRSNMSSVSESPKVLSSSTSSSSPMISAPTSPDEEAAKKSSTSEDDDEETTADKVSSGLFQTFDNLL